jgi:hypothetical protein
VVQIVVHQLVPKTNQKKIRWEKKGTIVRPMEAAQIWRECYDQKKNVQSSGRRCFSAGSNYNRKKLRPAKKVQLSRLTGRFFRRIQITTRKNYDWKNKRYSWPMEAAQIWRERYERKKHTQSSGRQCFQRVQITTGKKL